MLIGVALALSIALGFGLKGHAGNIVSAVYVRDIYRRGTEIDIDGDTLKIMGVGPVTTKLQKDDGTFVVVPNDLLLSEKIKGKVNV